MAVENLVDCGSQKCIANQKLIGTQKFQGFSSSKLKELNQSWSETLNVTGVSMLSYNHLSSNSFTVGTIQNYSQMTGIVTL